MATFNISTIAVLVVLFAMTTNIATMDDIASFIWKCRTGLFVLIVSYLLGMLFPNFLLWLSNKSYVDDDEASKPLFIITWNVLCGCPALKKALNDQTFWNNHTEEDRLELIAKTLKDLIEKYPNAIINLQEFGKNERKACMNAIPKEKYHSIGSKPSRYATDDEQIKFWRDIREDNCVFLLVPLTIDIISSNVHNMMQMSDEQMETLKGIPFLNRKGEETGKSFYDEFVRRISLVSQVTFQWNGKIVTILAVHLPCVYYSDRFQSIVMEALKKLVSLFTPTSDLVIVYGDFNTMKYKFGTEEKDQVWSNLMYNTISDLLPEGFKAIKNLRVAGFWNAPDGFNTSWNGQPDNGKPNFKGAIDQCIIFTCEKSTLEFKVSAMDALYGNEFGMKHSGPYLKVVTEIRDNEVYMILEKLEHIKPYYENGVPYASDHIPIGFTIEEKVNV